MISAAKMMGEKGVFRRLHSGWSVRAVDGPIPESLAGLEIPAQVPGTVHTDLMAAGLIPDLNQEQHETSLTWIGRSDWEYRATFDWDSDGFERHDLVCEGLDTVATIRLNGKILAETHNQHRSYRLDLRGALQRGPNELVVAFASPVSHADSMSLELGYRPHNFAHPFNAIRKAAYNFGWDWGPDAPSVGIWRPLGLHSWSSARIAGVRPVITVEGGVGRVAVHVGVERHLASDITVRASVEGTRTATETRLEAHATDAVLDLAVPQPELWWPRGFGQQPLYRLTVELLVGDESVSRWSKRIGFRTVEAAFTPDEHGTGFEIRVNHTPIWVRGANWIADDVFQHRVDSDRYARRIDQAASANINLLRVWGGGHYESEEFYDLCDERGILVWQDFLFACAAYAEDRQLSREIEAEAREHIVRLMPHPSLILWCGNNECNWGVEEWGWGKRLQGRTWGRGYYFELLPSLIAELDPGRAYVPGSPWSGVADHTANHTDHGLVHLWETWNRFDYNRYRDYIPRFCVEFGWQGPPTWATLTQSLSDRPLTPESPGMLSHQKAPGGNDKLLDGLLDHLPLPDGMEEWHWAMSLNQALAITLAVGHLRSWRPRCAGSIVWQLNDCWPGITWSAIDGGGRAKPLLHALRHVYEDRFMTVQPRGDDLVLAVDNDSPGPWSGRLSVRRLDFAGTPLASYRADMELGPRTNTQLRLPPGVAVPGERRGELLVCELGGVRALWFFAEYRDSLLAEPELKTRVARSATGYRVEVTARNLVRDVSLLVDKADPDAVVDDMLVTLLPGESHTFAVTTARDLDPDRLVSGPVLRCGNQLVVGHRRTS